MIKRKRFLQNESPGIFAQRFAARFVVAASLLLLSTAAAMAVPVREYQARIGQAVKALDALAHSEKSESDAAYFARDEETIRGVRVLLAAPGPRQVQG
jgi:hypothetical protein